MPAQLHGRPQAIADVVTPATIVVVRTSLPAVSSCARPETRLVVVDVRSAAGCAPGAHPRAVHLALAELVQRIVEHAPDLHAEDVVYCWGPGCNGSTRAGLALARARCSGVPVGTRPPDRAAGARSRVVDPRPVSAQVGIDASGGATLHGVRVPRHQPASVGVLGCCTGQWSPST